MESATERRLHRSFSMGKRGFKPRLPRETASAGKRGFKPRLPRETAPAGRRAFKARLPGNLDGVQVKRCGKSAPVHKVTYGAR